MTTRSPLIRSRAFPALLASLLLGFTGLTASAQETKRAFDIPAGKAEVTLKTFSDQAGAQFFFSAEKVGGVRTAPLKGEFTPREALDQMLRDTGLVAVQDEKTGALSVRRSESPNAPRVAPEAATTPEDRGKIEQGKVVFDKVEVTGSRIHTTLGEATPNPVLSYTQVDLGRMGIMSAYDLGRYIPQLGMEMGADPETQGNYGSQFRGVVTTFSDLRGVGSTFSLVLVNGRRLPRAQQYNGFDSQDLSGIPFAAIERIEILPAGASAIYGTNAVTGVINIILRKDYNATASLALSYRNTWHTDAGKRSAALSFGQGRGKFAYSGTLEWSDSNSLAPRDRWWNASLDMRPYGGNDQRSPIPGGAGQVRSTNGAALPGLTSDRAAIPANADGRALTVTDFANAGAIADKADTLQYADNATLRERKASFRMEYAWRPWAKLFASGIWAEKIARRPGNYTIPFYGSTTGSRSESLSFTLPAGYAGNPFGVPILVEKVVWDLIPYLEAQEKSVNPNFEFGVTGDLPHGWTYEAYVRDSWANLQQFGSLSFSVATGGTARVNALINNADPALRPLFVYNSQLYSPNSPAVMRSLFEQRPIRSQSVNWEYAVRADGPVWTLPTGEVRAALSSTYYENYVDSQYIPTDTAQNSVAKGSINGWSWEYSGQVQVPLVNKVWKLPLLHELIFNGTAGATKQGSPSGSGTVFDLGLIWRPLPWLTLRGNRSESYKLPTVYQAFRPVTTTNWPFASLAPIDAGSRVLDPARGGTLILYNIPVSSGGNPNLRPQNGLTHSASFEIEVPKVKGLKLAAVWSDTQIENQITSPSGVYQLLFTSFPERVTRADLTPADQALGYAGGLVTFIDATNINLNQYHTKNLDLSVEYRHDFAKLGQVSLSIMGTKPLGNYSIATPGATPVNLDYASYGRYTTSLAWSRQAWSAGAVLRYSEAWQGTSVASILNIVPVYRQYDFWVGYDFGKSRRRFEGWTGRVLSDLSVTLRGIDVFSQDPQFQRANGYIVGRASAYQAQYQIDVRKRF